nr:hypothetical protein [Maliibacterium massiliense]
MNNDVNAGNAPGKGLLKVSGILMVIFSAIALVTLLFTTILVGSAAGALAGAGAAAAGVGIMLLTLVPAVLELITGILGIINANKPEKATICMVFGIICLALYVISIFSGGFQWTTLVGAVLPILYVVGAVKNRQAA